MQRVYDRGGLYTLNLHPERGVLCRRALDTLLAYARSRELPVWVARIGEIAQWWKERSQFRFTFTSVDERRWRVAAACSEKPTILARNLAVEGQAVRPWHGADEWVQSQDFIVNAPACPSIALSEQTPGEMMDFLHQQGYPATRCTREEAVRYALHLDRPQGWGSTPEEQLMSKIALVEQIEALEQPLVRFGCWPDGNRAALCISGDIDSITVQDFFLRVVEVFRHK